MSSYVERTRLPFAAFQAALYSRIAGAEHTPAIRCFTNMPQSAFEAFPYVLIGRIAGTPDLELKVERLWSLTVDLHFWSQPSTATNEELLDLMGTVLPTIMARDIDPGDGWKVLTCEVQQAEAFDIDADDYGVIHHGMLTLRFQVQDAS